jgi:hypothetical protein
MHDCEDRDPAPIIRSVISRKRFRHRRLVLAARPLAVIAFMLMAAPAAASGERVMPSTAAAQVTLTVSLAGPGTGSVTSYPAGISCGTNEAICSAQFADGTAVTLEAQGEGSNPDGFSTAAPYSCDEVYVPSRPPHTDSCSVTMDYYNLGPSASVQVTFNPTAPPHCIVPRARGRTLAGAKARIRQSHCGVGTITHAFSRNVQEGRVISQDPPARRRQERGAKVDLVVSKGRR